MLKILKFRDVLNLSESKYLLKIEYCAKYGVNMNSKFAITYGDIQ